MRVRVAGTWPSCRKNPRASTLSERAISGFPVFFDGPHASFFARKEGFVCRAPSSASLGRWVSARFAGRAPEPLHGARGRSGVPLAFCATLAHPFRLEEGVICRALECEPGSLGLGKVAGRAPEPPARSERAIRSSPSFLCDPRASFLFGRRGCLPSPRVRVWVAGSRLGL